LFLRCIRPKLCQWIARWTGSYRSTIDQVLKEMIARCRELELRVHRLPRQNKLETGILLTVQTMNDRHGGNHRVMQ